VDYDDLKVSRVDGAAAPNGCGTRRVIGWVSTASIENRGLVDIGGWGGFFRESDDWSAYIANIDKEFVPHHESLRLAIIAKGLRRGGDWHQNSQDGVPVFNDGAVGTFSFRAWGDLMAATWTGEDGRGYGYMDFYMDACLERAGIALSPPLGPA
jgi:hypothetical protein